MALLWQKGLFRKVFWLAKVTCTITRLYKKNAGMAEPGDHNKVNPEPLTNWTHRRIANDNEIIESMHTEICQKNRQQKFKCSLFVAGSLRLEKDPERSRGKLRERI